MSLTDEVDASVNKDLSLEFFEIILKNAFVGEPGVTKMKTLLLLRHVKSSWDDSSLSDHDRPLNRPRQSRRTQHGTIAP